MAGRKCPTTKVDCLCFDDVQLLKAEQTDMKGIMRRDHEANEGHFSELKREINSVKSLVNLYNERIEDVHTIATDTKEFMKRTLTRVDNYEIDFRRMETKTDKSMQHTDTCIDRIEGRVDDAIKMMQKNHVETISVLQQPKDPQAMKLVKLLFEDKLGRVAVVICVVVIVLTIAFGGGGGLVNMIGGWFK